MPPEILPIDHASPALQAYFSYRRLMESTESANVAGEGLGGKLLYVGELNELGCADVIAGNVAGCATLATSADPQVQKQAVRDGVVDFLVASLDEALRILKNEIRKHSTVAVCVALPKESIEGEMQERGVAPDIFGSKLLRERHEAIASGVVVAWSVHSLPAKWLPVLDRIALDCLRLEDIHNRRWIQRSPRYLGRLAGNMRTVCSDREFVSGFIEQVRSAFDSGGITAAATVWVTTEAGSEEVRFQPGQQPAS